MSLCATYKISIKYHFVHKMYCYVSEHFHLAKQVANSNTHSLSMTAKWFSDKYFSDVNKKLCLVPRLWRDSPLVFRRTSISDSVGAEG